MLPLDARAVGKDTVGVNSADTTPTSRAEQQAYNISLHSIYRTVS